MRLRQRQHQHPAEALRRSRARARETERGGRRGATGPRPARAGRRRSSCRRARSAGSRRAPRGGRRARPRARSSSDSRNAAPSSGPNSTACTVIAGSPSAAAGDVHERVREARVVDRELAGAAVDEVAVRRQRPPLAVVGVDQALGVVDPDRPVEPGPRHVLEHRAHVEQSDERGRDDGRDASAPTGASRGRPAHARILATGLPGMGSSRNVRAVSTSGADPGTAAPRVTVVFLLYNAAAEVAELVESLRAPAPPCVRAPVGLARGALRRRRLERRDGRGREARARGGRRPCRTTGWSRIARNLGLAGTLNEVFAAGARAVRAHVPPRLPLRERRTTSPRCSSSIERHPHAAAITGQPRLQPSGRAAVRREAQRRREPDGRGPDVRTSAELVPVGFAEGRCDVFRVEALRGVGLYDTHLRVSGEDQVLAARLRASGLRDLPGAAARVPALGVGGAGQRRQAASRHQRLFGRTTPYIVLAVPGSLAGLVGQARRREPQAAQPAARHAARVVRGLRARGAARGSRAGPSGAWAARSAWWPPSSSPSSRATLRAVRFSPAELLALRAAPAGARPRLHGRHRRGPRPARARPRRPIG